MITVVDRSAYLNGLIGIPWVANARGPDAYDCYHLARKVQLDLWRRELDDINVPSEPSWRYMINAIQNHPERQKWAEITPVPGNVHMIADGALVAMGASARSAHLGTWFSVERRILHVDNPDGVTFQDQSSLRAMGWHLLRFFEYIGPR